MDGVLEGETVFDPSRTLPTFSGNIRTNHDPVFIGKRPASIFSLGKPFDGQIDDVRIYDQALSGDEVFELYNSARAPDTDGDGFLDSNEDCPIDPNKTDPGQCGCGVIDTDADGDSVADCNDICSDDPLKVDPQACGCGFADADSDTDGVPDCTDVCPGDATNQCDVTGSAAQPIGPSGGTLATPDEAVAVTIPPGALAENTILSVTDIGSGFELNSNLGQSVAIFGVEILPEGTTFNVPITLVFAWDDADDNGEVDGTNIQEKNLRITKDGVAITAKCQVNPGWLRCQCEYIHIHG